MLHRDGYGDLQIYNMQMLNWLVSMNVFAFTTFLRCLRTHNEQQPELSDMWSNTA